MNAKPGEGSLLDRGSWEWFGSAGHLIVAANCRFHLCTAVGNFMVSTVGEYVPDSHVREVMAKSRGIALEGQGDYRESSWLRENGFEEIGHGRTYETMVFRFTARCDTEECGCGMPRPDEWGELDSGCYNDAASATRGHYAMCEKWAARPDDSGPAWEDDDA